MTSELVTDMSETEAQTRVKLSWQEFDYSLWLATCASPDSSVRQAIQEVMHSADGADMVIGEQIP